MSVSIEGQQMNGFAKLSGIAFIAAAVALASFQDTLAMAMSVTALAIAAFTAVSVLVGAAVATRHTRRAKEAGRAPVLDAAPVIAPLQEQ